MYEANGSLLGFMIYQTEKGHYGRLQLMLSVFILCCSVFDISCHYMGRLWAGVQNGYQEDIYVK